MAHVELSVAAERLEEIVEQAIREGEVILTRDGVPVAKLVPIARDGLPRKFGSARGQTRMGDDFDAPLEEFGDET